MARIQMMLAIAAFAGCSRCGGEESGRKTTATSTSQATSPRPTRPAPTDTAPSGSDAGAGPSLDPRCEPVRDAPGDLALRLLEGEAAAGGEAPLVVALLCNVSDRAWTYTVDSGFQSVELELRSAEGKLLEPVSIYRRRRRRFALREGDFHTLGPGEAAEVGWLKQAVHNGRYTVDWLPWKFRDPEPGVYEARALWSAEHDTTSDGETIEGVWKGELRTPWREVRLPPAPGPDE